MMVKIILLFLLVMALIGMIGNLLFPGRLSGAAKKRLGAKKPSTCSRCGRYVIGTSGCDCGKK